MPSDELELKMSSIWDRGSDGNRAPAPKLMVKVTVLEPEFTGTRPSAMDWYHFPVVAESANSASWE